MAEGAVVFLFFPINAEMLYLQLNSNNSCVKAADESI